MLRCSARHRDASSAALRCITCTSSLVMLSSFHTRRSLDADGTGGRFLHRLRSPCCHPPLLPGR